MAVIALSVVHDGLNAPTPYLGRKEFTRSEKKIRLISCARICWIRKKIKCISIRAFVIDRFRSRLRVSDMKTPIWIKRLGIWGFLFFLVKALLWLLVPPRAVYLAK